MRSAHLFQGKQLPAPLRDTAGAALMFEDADMCRNIRTLFNFEPPATDDEIHASALQFVRKLSGFSRPSQANEAAFNAAVIEVSEAARRLVDTLSTSAPARDRQVEAKKARARSRERFAGRAA